MEPINYAGMIQSQQNPLSGLLQGLQIASALKGISSQRKEEEYLDKAREEATQMKEQFRTEFSNYMQKPSYDGLMALQIKFPEFADRIKPLVANIDKKQLQSDLGATYQALSAIQSGKPELALSVVDNYMKAAENSGIDTSKISQIRTAIETNPEGAATQLEAMAGILDPDMYKKFTESRAKSSEMMREEKLLPSKLLEAEAKAKTAGGEAIIKTAEAEYAPAQQKAKTREAEAKAISEEWTAKYAPKMKEAGLSLNRAQIANIGSMIKDRTARLNLDQQKASIDIAEKMQKLSNKASKLSAPSLKMVNDAVVNSASSKQAAQQLNTLAGKLDKINSWSGYAGSGAEFLKKSMGIQDAASAVKKEYVKLRNESVIKSLPPGSASDRDISTFMAGFPDENANPKHLASFLRGMAKAQTIAAKTEEAKADWITETGGSLGRSTSDFTAGGYKVKAGQSFGDFSASVANAVTQKKKRDEEAGTRNIGAPAPLVPTGKAKNIMSKADLIIYGGK